MSEKHDPKGTDEGHAPLAGVSGMLPNEIDLELLSKLLMYSDKYEISIQFWPKQTAVYIAKDGVELKDFGGDFEFAVRKGISYLYGIQPKRKASQLRYTNIDDRDDGWKERD